MLAAAMPMERAKRGSSFLGGLVGLGGRRGEGGSTWILSSCSGGRGGACWGG